MYKSYIAANPNTIYTSRFHVEMIETYKKGRYAKEYLQETEQFVVSYGSRSQYWAQW